MKRVLNIWQHDESWIDSLLFNENFHIHYRGKIEKEGKNNSHHLGFVYSNTPDCSHHVYKIWRLALIDAELEFFPVFWNKI